MFVRAMQELWTERESVGDSRYFGFEKLRDRND